MLTAQIRSILCNRTVSHVFSLSAKHVEELQMRNMMEFRIVARMASITHLFIITRITRTGMQQDQF